MSKFIKFEKNGCMPCKRMDMILKQFDVEYKHFNVDENDYTKELEEYGIKSVPALLKIEDDGSHSVLLGINHTKAEFRNFLEIGTMPIMASVDATTDIDHCANGVCSL